MTINFRSKRTATWSGCGGEAQVQGHQHQQQAELEAQQRGCILEGEEHFILPKDAETVQRASK